MIDHDDEIRHRITVLIFYNLTYLMELEITTELHFMLTPSILLKHIKCLSGLRMFFILDLRIHH